MTERRVCPRDAEQTGKINRLFLARAAWVEATCTQGDVPCNVSPICCLVWRMTPLTLCTHCPCVLLPCPHQNAAEDAPVMRWHRPTVPLGG
ncbi:hypothetical protein FKM82_018447 [Ascaphus truei]